MKPEPETKCVEIGKNTTVVKIDRLHSLLWRSETECTSALCMHAIIAPLMPLHHVKFLVRFSSVTPECKTYEVVQ